MPIWASSAKASSRACPRDADRLQIAWTAMGGLAAICSAISSAFSEPAVGDDVPDEPAPWLSGAGPCGREQDLRGEGVRDLTDQADRGSAEGGTVRGGASETPNRALSPANADVRCLLQDFGAARDGGLLRPAMSGLVSRRPFKQCRKSGHVHPAGELSPGAFRFISLRSIPAQNVPPAPCEDRDPMSGSESIRSQASTMISIILAREGVARLGRFIVTIRTWSRFLDQAVGRFRRNVCIYRGFGGHW